VTLTFRYKKTCEHWWELWCFIFPTSRSRQAWIAHNMTWDKSKVVLRLMDKTLGWEKNLGLKGIVPASYGRQAPDVGSWTWFYAETWRPVLTRRDSDPRLRHLVKSIMYLSTDEYFQLLGEISANDDHDQWALRRIRWLYVVGWHHGCVNSTEWPRLSQTEHPLLQGGSVTQSPSTVPWMPRILSENKQDMYGCGNGQVIGSFWIQHPVTS